MSNILFFDNSAGTLPDSLRSERVTVLSSQILALSTTPVTLVATSSNSTLMIVERIIYASTFNTTAYTGANNLEFRYASSSGDKLTADIAAATLNSSTAGTRYATVSGVNSELQARANASIVVTVPVADPAAGNSNVVFDVMYRVAKPI